MALGGDGVGDDAGVTPVAQASEVVVHGGNRRGDDHELAVVFDESAEGGVVGAGGRLAPASLGGGGAGGGIGIDPEDAHVGHLGRQRPGQRRPDEPEADDGDGREGGVGRDGSGLRRGARRGGIRSRFGRPAGAVQFSRFSHGSVCFLNRSGTSRHPLYTKPPPPHPNTHHRRIFRTSDAYLGR